MAIFTVPPVTHALGVLFSSATALAAARLAGGLALAGYLLLLTPLYARLYGPDPHGGLGLLPSFVPAGLAAAAAAAAAAELWARPAASGAADRGCPCGAKPRGARVVRRLCGAAGMHDIIQHPDGRHMAEVVEELRFVQVIVPAVIGRAWRGGRG